METGHFNRRVLSLVVGLHFCFWYCMYVCVRVCACCKRWCPQSPDDGAGCTGAGVVSICEPTDVGAGN